MYKQFDIINIDSEMMDIVKKYPKIFLEPSEVILFYFEKSVKSPENTITCNVKENLVNLRYGFEHGCGWKSIVDGFCADMQALCDEAEENGLLFQYKACIMKEKFGIFTPQGNYFYDENKGKVNKEYFSRANEIISKWEDESLKVCEITGESGKLRKRGYWVKTLCDEKAAEYDYK